jgi:hypothetical protein
MCLNFVSEMTLNSRSSPCATVMARREDSVLSCVPGCMSSAVVVCEVARLVGTSWKWQVGLMGDSGGAKRRWTCCPR